MLKNILLKSDFEAGCDHGLYSNTLSQVEAVGKELNLNSSDEKEDVSKETLEKAGKMFIYLNPCLDSINPWINFYKQLFQNETNVILLTLNRVLKAKNSQDDFTNITVKVFSKIVSMLSLKHKDILNLAKDNDTQIYNTSKTTNDHQGG